MKKLSLLVAFAVLVPVALNAQDFPKAEVFGGYRLIHEEDLTLHGFGVAVEGNISRNFGIVGDFGLGMKSVTEYGVDVDMKEFTFMGGPRYSYRTDKARVFVHALFGGTRVSGGSDYQGISVGASSTGFSMAFGGGVDISLSKTISIRPAQLDLLTSRWSIMGESGWGNQLRYSAGVVFKLGSN